MRIYSYNTLNADFIGVISPSGETPIHKIHAKQSSANPFPNTTSSARETGFFVA
jgi:hypothetical protein